MVILTDQKLTIRGAAFYSDRYTKVDGEWLIRHTGYQRVYEEMGRRPDDLKLTASRWGLGA